MDKLDKLEFEDLELECFDCGKPFLFFAGEQWFFHNKKLSKPKRCPHCRIVRKQSLQPDEPNTPWGEKDGNH